MLTQNKNKKIYVVLLYKLLVDEIKFSRNYRRFVKCETFEIEKFELSAFIKNLIKIFFEILSNNFNTYNQVEHIINLKKKQLLKFEFIYNMSQNEFAIIQKYFENSQQKQ